MQVLLSILFFLWSAELNDTVQFNLVSEISLPYEINLSQVEFVDVNRKGDLLLTDISTETVVLYESETDSFRELNPEECHPGFIFQPIRAHFVRNDIWVFNQQPQVFKFQQNGDCIGSIDRQMETPDLFTELDEETVAGLKPLNYDLKSPTLYLFDDTGTVKKNVDLGDHILAPVFSFRYGSGGMFSNSNRLYFALSSAPVIYSYDSMDDTIELHMPGENMGLSVVQNDDLGRDNRGNPGSMFNEVRDYLSRYTSTIQFSRLNDQYALIQIEQPGRSGRELLVFDMKNEQFMDHSYRMDMEAGEFYYAYANSKAYTITFRDEEDRWVLEVYEVVVMVKK